ncbi:MAG: type 1 glutamine amidotransferase [Mariniblastus sp.]|jgi:type 1 glutamine amidotransferase
MIMHRLSHETPNYCKKVDLMNHLLRLFVVVMVLGTWSSPGLFAQNAQGKKANKKLKPKPIKALLIAGGCCHDYPNQVTILTQGISQRANVEWEVVRGNSSRDRQLPIYHSDDWAKDYDVIVHNECYGAVEDVEFVERIVAGHTKYNIPVVAIHCSMHSYRNAKTDVWRELLGVTSRRHEKQTGSLDVVNRADQHPVMKPFGASWRTPAGELYVIEKAWPNCLPLATAYGVQGKADQTVVWTNEYKGVKVFGTTLGHHNQTMLCDEYLDLVTRGMLWSCGKLNQDGTVMSSFEGTGEAEILLPGMQTTGPPAATPSIASWADTVKFPKSEKAIALFNGKDFTGWHGNMKYWSIDEEAVVAKNDVANAPKASTYLLTDKKYRNFRLVFEGKLVTSGMHSGITLWGKAVEKESDPHSYQGHLVMFPGGYGFYDLYRRNMILKDDGSAKKAGLQGEWNKMEILAIGSRIRLVLNGQLVADWTDPKPELCEMGPIGLQLHSNKVAQEVRFRGLRLSENPEDKLITEAEQK